MTLMDASVVITYERGKDAKLNVLVVTLPTVVCGVTVSEALLVASGRRPSGRPPWPC